MTIEALRTSLLAVIELPLPPNASRELLDEAGLWCDALMHALEQCGPDTAKSPAERIAFEEATGEVVSATADEDDFRRNHHDYMARAKKRLAEIDAAKGARLSP